MTAARISVDELLAQQAAIPALRVTIKAVQGDDTLVKVTPIADGAVGCQCAFSLNVAKSEIVDVEPTGDISDCCGARLTVVKVEFSNPTLADVFSQLANRASGSVGGQAPSAMIVGSPAPVSNYPMLPSNLEMAAFTNFGIPATPAFAANEGWPVTNKFGSWVLVDPKTNMMGPSSSGKPTGAYWTEVRCQRAFTDCSQECNSLPFPSVESLCCHHRCHEEYLRCKNPNYVMEPCPQ